MEKGGSSFSGSEDFAKSLEPSYSKREEELVDRLNKAADRHAARQVKRELDAEVADQDDGGLSSQEPDDAPTADQLEAAADPHAHVRRKRFEFFAAIYLLFILFLIAFLAVRTDANPFVVLLSLLPALFTIIVAMLVYEAMRDNRNVLWAVPFVLILVFNFWGHSGGGIIAGIDVDVLTVLNILIAYLYLVINHFLLAREVVVADDVLKVEKDEELLPKDLQGFIASIEDKSKALNFVIGRVYNAYHGGTKDLRGRINMRQEWYDQFSKLPAVPAEIDFVALRKLVETILARLKRLESSEAEVFGLAFKEFKHLVHEADGSSRVIDVLDKNDKDPVMNYFDGALEFCGKVADFARHRVAPEVRNEYVARPDEHKKAAPRSSTWHSLRNLVKK